MKKQESKANENHAFIIYNCINCHYNSKSILAVYGGDISSFHLFEVLNDNLEA